MKATYVLFFAGCIAVQCSAGIPQQEETQVEVIENHTTNSDKTVNKQTETKNAAESLTVDDGSSRFSTDHETSAAKEKYHEEENQETNDKKTTKTTKKSNVGLSSLVSVGTQQDETVEEEDTSKTHREYDSETDTNSESTNSELVDENGYTRDSEDTTTAHKKTREEEDSERTKTVDKTKNTNISLNVMNKNILDKNVKTKQHKTSQEKKHKVTETDETSQTYSKTHEDQNGSETQDCKSENEGQNDGDSGLPGGL